MSSEVGNGGSHYAANTRSVTEKLRDAVSAYGDTFDYHECLALYAIVKTAEKVVEAYTAEAEDWNDGEFALWRKEDLGNALVALRATL